MILLLLACTPTCEEVCVKLVDECGDLGTERQSPYECEIQCESQERLLKDWNDLQAREAFREELRCLASSTCEEISDGVCYDELVWGF